MLTTYDMYAYFFFLFVRSYRDLAAQSYCPLGTYILLLDVYVEYIIMLHYHTSKKFKSLLLPVGSILKFRWRITIA
jgi:hypothetical protein